MANETRSERAKRLRREGKFIPRNPGRPRRVTDENEIRRQALLDIIQKGTPRQRLDASKALSELDERAPGPPRRDFDSMTDDEIERHFEALVQRTMEHWASERLVPQMRELFEQHGMEQTFDRTVATRVIQKPSVRSTL